MMWLLTEASGHRGREREIFFSPQTFRLMCELWQVAQDLIFLTARKQHKQL